jgi:hypothetical protein
MVLVVTERHALKPLTRPTLSPRPYRSGSRIRRSLPGRGLFLGHHADLRSPVVHSVSNEIPGHDYSHGQRGGVPDEHARLGNASRGRSPGYRLSICCVTTGKIRTLENLPKTKSSGESYSNWNCRHSTNRSSESQRLRETSQTKSSPMIKLPFADRAEAGRSFIWERRSLRRLGNGLAEVDYGEGGGVKRLLAPREIHDRRPTNRESNYTAREGVLEGRTAFCVARRPAKMRIE